MAALHNLPTAYSGDHFPETGFTFDFDLTGQTPTVVFQYNGGAFHTATTGSGLTVDLGTNTITVEPFVLPTAARNAKLAYDLSLVDAAGSKTTYLFGFVPLTKDIAP